MGSGLGLPLRRARLELEATRVSRGERAQRRPRARRALATRAQRRGRRPSASHHPSAPLPLRLGRTGWLEPGGSVALVRVRDRVRDRIRDRDRVGIRIGLGIGLGIGTGLG